MVNSQNTVELSGITPGYHDDEWIFIVPEPYLIFKKKDGSRVHALRHPYGNLLYTSFDKGLFQLRLHRHDVFSCAIRQLSPGMHVIFFMIE